MPDVKKAAIVAASAFVISFLVGLLSGVGFLFILLRAFVFSALFFGLFFGAYFLFSRFLPDLLASASSSREDDDETGGTGSRLDISVDDHFGSDTDATVRAPVSGAPLETEADIAPIPPEGNPAGDDEDVEELEELDGEADELETQGEKQTGLDRSGEAGYTKAENVADSVPPGPSKPASQMDSPSYAKPLGGFDDVDKLPDLDGFSESFAPESYSDDGTDSVGSAASAVPSGDIAVSSSASAGGNFDTKEMVSAIQTMLKRDQKG